MAEVPSGVGRPINTEEGGIGLDLSDKGVDVVVKPLTERRMFTGVVPQPTCEIRIGFGMEDRAITNRQACAPGP